MCLRVSACVCVCAGGAAARPPSAGGSAPSETSGAAGLRYVQLPAAARTEGGAAGCARGGGDAAHRDGGRDRAEAAEARHAQRGETTRREKNLQIAAFSTAFSYICLSRACTFYTLMQNDELYQDRLRTNIYSG